MFSITPTVKCWNVHAGLHVPFYLRSKVTKPYLMFSPMVVFNALLSFYPSPSVNHCL